jgi:hypothetical protein
VMHDQKIDLFSCGLGQDARRNIDSRTNFRHATRIFDLKAVERIRPIVDFMNAQVFVNVSSNLRNKRNTQFLHGKRGIDVLLIDRTCVAGRKLKLSPEHRALLAAAILRDPIGRADDHARPQ